MKISEWTKLEHAYGGACNIPDLLDQLKSYPACENYEDEPFFTLWSSLCHQGDVFSASYAAVPIIVSLIEQNPNRVNFNYFLLPVCIEIARIKGAGPEINPDLKDDYLKSIKLMANLAAELTTKDPLMITVLSASVAVSKGDAELAEVILELTPETIIEFREWQESR